MGLALGVVAALPDTAYTRIRVLVGTCNLPGHRTSVDIAAGHRYPGRHSLIAVAADRTRRLLVLHIGLLRTVVAAGPHTEWLRPWNSSGIGPSRSYRTWVRIGRHRLLFRSLLIRRGQLPLATFRPGDRTAAVVVVVVP